MGAWLRSALCLARAAFATLVLLCPTLQPAAAGDGAITYAQLADEASASLLQSFYAGRGLWRDCPETRCWVHNSDWGSDALSATLYLRWKQTRGARPARILAALAASERRYAAACHDGSACSLWSDVPLWDAVADAREHEVAPHEARSLQKAEAAFWAVEGSKVYGVGACPTIRYQRPFGRGDRLKTLETDSNGIKAALLLFDATHEGRYLAIARKRYAAVRRYFLDARQPLYSVYVFDDGVYCRQLPHRYFASVNGNMIWNGLRLARLTQAAGYRVQALATAHAVARYLADANGIFSDLQAENDVAEPLVEAMLEASALRTGAFARRWLLTNASAAYSARRYDGTYGRFFDGPPPESAVTAWQSNGGFALAIAAASLAPEALVEGHAWRDATFVERDITRLPATIEFEGSGIALIGTLGEICCQPGHARIFVDGRETIDRIGIWQNKSSSGRRFPNSVLFAWRWPASGRHRLTLEPGTYDAKEGGSFLHVRGYSLVRGRAT